MIYSLNQFKPVIGPGVFVAPSAQIIGDVEVGENSSIWFQAVLRGDVMPIRIGKETNIQDSSVIHGTYKKCGATIGDQVSVGHQVILHGCQIDDRVLVGMGSVIMDQAHIPSDCIVGAGSLVTETSTFESGHLILGRPARAVRPLKEKELAFLKQSAKNYMEYMSWYQDFEPLGAKND